MRQSSLVSASLLLLLLLASVSLLLTVHAGRKTFLSSSSSATSSSASSKSTAKFATHQEAIDYGAKLLKRAFVPGHAWASSSSSSSDQLGDGDEHGGTNCAACVIIVDLLYQYSVIHEKSIGAVVEEICSFLPDPLTEPCKYAVEKFGPAIINALENKETPETACKLTTLCKDTVCQLHAPTTDGLGVSREQVYDLLLKQREQVKAKKASPKTASTTAAAASAPRLQENGVLDRDAETPWEWLKKEIDHVFNTHEPLVDLDGDNFATIETFRGASWRGRDCDDLDKSVYPGRNSTHYSADRDHNCNGIRGTAPSGRTYEQELCSSVPNKGVIALGDSATAHFRIPGEWMTAADIDAEIYKHAVFVLENEVDWPQLSAYTGYTNFSYGLTPGPMESVYTLMLKRNRCIHRDYQNCGVNGARVGSIADGIAQSMSRDQQNDNPALVFHALIGNDVCNGHPDTFDHMTKPEDFEASVLKTLNYLDTRLPPGSSVVFVGLVDGRILYNTMHALMHPIQATYAQVYNYLNCLSISPCRGWLNTNSTIRDMTTDHANLLNSIYPKIISQHKFKNFNMVYYGFSELINEAITRWTAKGGKISDLIEPVDGFHPSQTALWLTSTILFEHMLAEHPEIVGPINPNNAVIQQLFGDQGGY